MGAFHGDEIGLIWADVRVSARNLVRGTLNPHLENPLMFAPEERRARLTEIQRRRAARRRKFEFEDADDEREEQSIIADLRQMGDSIARFAEGDQLSSRFYPDCDEAVKAELAASHKEVLKAAAPEIKAAEEAAPPGWQVSGKRVSAPFISITQRIKISELAAKPALITRGDLRRNVQKGVQQVCEPGFDRKPLAAAVSAFIAATLANQPPISELRPSRWYPSNPVAGRSADDAAPMVKLALSAHKRLPPQPTVPLDDLMRSLATLPKAGKADPERAKRWRRWNNALKAAERKMDFRAIAELYRVGPDPPN